MGNMYSGELRRDVLVTAVTEEVTLDFNFVADSVVIGANRTITFANMSLENLRRGAGLGIDLFVGADNSTLELLNVMRWRYVCTASTDAVKAHMSYPRAPGVPGPQRVTTIPTVCWKGTCYDGGCVHYVDVAMVVAPGMTESTDYLPGYTLLIRNTTRVCSTYVPDACLETHTRDECLVQYTEAYIASTSGGDGHKTAAVTGGVAAAVGALAVGSAAAAAVAVWRRRRRRRKMDDEEAAAAAKAMMRFGPLEDMVLSNKQHGWRVMHHAAPASAHNGRSSLSDRIDLGVLLGAGSFGRVYRGRWQGKDVAVKVMQHDARTAHRIANEVELMMMMEHANILKAYDVVTWTHSSGNNPHARRLSAGQQDNLQSRTSATESQQLPAIAPQRQRGVSGASNADAASQQLQRHSGSLLASAAASSNTSAANRLLPPLPPAHGGGGGGVQSGEAVTSSPVISSGGGASGAMMSGPAAPPVGRSSGSFGARGAVSYVPVKSLAGGAIAPLLLEEPPGGGPGGGLGQGAPAAGGNSLATTLSRPLPPGVGGVGGAAVHSQRLLGGPPGPGAGPLLLLQQGGSGGSGSAGAGSGGLSPDAEAQTWLIVEFCDSGTLCDAVRNGKLGPKGEPDMARVLVRLRDVASGMAYLHSRNVLHGDLKAANVLLSSSSTTPSGMVAKVADFGLSRMLKVGQTHRSTRTVGTVTHMPPELLRLGKLSPAGDVYAFGIIMWELFTCSAAFERQHYGEVFERVVLRDERPPIPDGMPEAYALLMTRCWQADPMQRPGFDTVLKLVDIMLEETAAAAAAVGDAPAAGAQAGRPAGPPAAGLPGGAGGPLAGATSDGATGRASGATSGGVGAAFRTGALSSSGAAAADPGVAPPGGAAAAPRDGSQFFQDL